MVIKKKKWKLLLHLWNAAICALTLRSLRVRLIKLHCSCNALWADHRCGSHQSAPITCSIPAPDKWQPTTSLQPLVPSGLLINGSANQPLSEECRAERTCCKLQWWAPERCLSVRSPQMLFNFLLELYPKMEMRWQSSTNPHHLRSSLRLRTALATEAWALKLD